MFLDTAIAKLAGTAIPEVGDNSSDAEKEESCCKLTMSLMARNISGWATRFNEKERGNYYSFILRGVPDKFLKEIFQIRAASEMLTVNVETIRRKIRDKKIPVLNEGKVNTGVGYEITGATVISLAKKNYQKESVLAYCIEKYPREMVISLIQLLIKEGKGFKDLTEAMIKSLVTLAHIAELKLKDVPEGIVAETNESIYENYLRYLADVKEARENNCEKEKVNSSEKKNMEKLSQKEEGYMKKIEQLEKENSDLFAENLDLKWQVNKMMLEITIRDFEKVRDDTNSIEYRNLIRQMARLRDRIDFIEEWIETGEQPGVLGINNEFAGII